jgi:predicted amidohydrolase YtcJ
MCDDPAVRYPDLKGLPFQASNPHQSSIHSERTRHRITSFQYVDDNVMLRDCYRSDKNYLDALSHMTADIIITNARIITMDKANPLAEAMAISGNRILRVGTEAEIMQERGSRTRVHDNQGNSVIPGIIEGHVHLFIGAAELDLLNIRYNETVDSLHQAVQAYRQKKPGLTFLHAISAAHEQFGTGVRMNRHLLDSVVPDIPFAISCFDHHTVWVNTKALEKTGIFKGRALSQGNEIVMGANGLATGELREFEAFAPVLELGSSGGRESAGIVTGRNPSPAPTANQRAADVETMRKGIAHANSLGITSMHNMDGNRYQLELLHALETRGELNARVEVPFHFRNTMALQDVDEAMELQQSFTTDMLHSGRVKLFIDGVMETLTALMLDDYPGHPGNKGAPLYSAEQLNAVVTRADKHGLQIATHAIGDGGVRRTLDAYEVAQRANGKRDSRHRIEHIELIDPKDIPRLAELGVVASLQPIAGIGVPGSPLEPMLCRLGDKLPWAYAWQTIRNSGAAVAFSSDWPVAPLDPFIGMQSAMTVKSLRPDCPDQKQSLMDTIHGFTAAGAYMEFMEDRKGMLKQGYLADVTVLDLNLEDLPANRIAEAKPVLTICDGRVVYEGNAQF